LTQFEVTTAHCVYPELEIPAAHYQASNTATAIFAVEAALGRALDPNKVRATIAEMTFPGRFEVFRTEPLLIFDGSHNPAASQILSELIAELSRTKLAGVKPLIVLGILADKDARDIIKALDPVAADFIVIEPPSDRAIPATELAALIEEVTGKAPLATFSLCSEQDCAESKVGAVESQKGSASARSAIVSHRIDSGTRYEDCAEHSPSGSQRSDMDKLLRKILNTTERQPVIVTGSLSLYPLLQSIRLCDADDFVGIM